MIEFIQQVSEKHPHSLALQIAKHFRFIKKHTTHFPVYFRLAEPIFTRKQTNPKDTKGEARRKIRTNLENIRYKGGNLQNVCCPVAGGIKRREGTSGRRPDAAHPRSTPPLRPFGLPAGAAALSRRNRGLRRQSGQRRLPPHSITNSSLLPLSKKSPAASVRILHDRASSLLLLTRHDSAIAS